MSAVGQGFRSAVAKAKTARDSDRIYLGRQTGLTV